MEEIKKHSLLNGKQLNILNENQIENNNTIIIIEEEYILDSITSFYNIDSECNTDKKKREEFMRNKDKYTFNYINFNILEFIRIIGNHKNSADFIIELENNCLISGGTDNKLIIYSPYYNKIKRKYFPNSIYKIYETKMKKEEIQIIASSNEKTYLIGINKNNYELSSFQEDKGCSLCFKFKDEDFIICCQTGGFHLLNLFSKIIKIRQEMKIFDKSYKGGIIINDYIIALTSNRVIPYGEDKLVIYNKSLRKITFEVIGYSFIPSSNGLNIVTRNENTIILCACKKYLKDQKNGILLVNYEMGKKKKINHIFYNTKYFEVYCFCSIFIKDELNNKILEENIRKIDTDYFLVGGYDQKKNKGMIKLYKIIYTEKFIETKIEFIQDIDIIKSEKFKGFKEPISSMIQSKRNGNLLISSWDGNIYLFKPPNISYFLFYDQN